MCQPEEIRKHGKRSYLEHQDDQGSLRELTQYTYLYQHDNGFSFMFENLEPEKNLLVRMILTVENLADAEGSISKPGEIEWRVTLKPGDVAVRELWIVDIT